MSMQLHNEYMRLDEFRKNKGLSLSALARELGAPHATVVRRWCLPQGHPQSLIPSPRYMSAILDYSDGAVQPNDFYGAMPNDRG